MQSNDKLTLTSFQEGYSPLLLQFLVLLQKFSFSLNSLDFSAAAHVLYQITQIMSHTLSNV